MDNRFTSQAGRYVKTQRKEVNYMDLLLTLIFGALTGIIASRLMGTGHSLLMDMFLGIIGAFVGSFLMNMFGQTGVTGFNFYSFFVSVLGAVIVIALSRMFTSRRGVV
jgi:uncharacterized membrane protein YeaQ/YmgE (transglycosylase-associated protein family)